MSRRRTSAVSRPPRVGVVGMGEMGRVHAQVLAATPRAELVGCADPADAARAFSPPTAQTFATYEELYERSDLDAVVVATPERSHREPVEAALRAGLDVLVEKPIASTLDDADSMIRTAQETQRLLAVGHLLRSDVRYCQLADQVAAGSLGEAIFLTARRNGVVSEGKRASLRTSLPLYLGAHDLDVFRWMAGPFERVYAEAVPSGEFAGAPAAIVATIRFRSGCVGSLELAWCLPERPELEWDYAFSFVGTRGCGYIDGRSKAIEVFTPSGPRCPDTIYWPVLRGEITGALRLQTEAFLGSITDSRRPAQPPHEARAALAASLAIEQSLELGLPIVIDDEAAS